MIFLFTLGYIQYHKNISNNKSLIEIPKDIYAINKGETDFSFTIEKITEDYYLEFSSNDHIEISKIFYPEENFKLPFTSNWKHTRENIGKHIIQNDFPVSFKVKKYFELYEFLKNRKK